MNHHDHDHGHSHEMTFPEKMKKLLDHWMKHNTDHARTYREWKDKAAAEGLTAVSEMLEEAAVLTLELNAKFEKALTEID